MSTGEEKQKIHKALITHMKELGLNPDSKTDVEYYRQRISLDLEAIQNLSV